MSENRSNDTGQISVAELLARNGQKVGTRAGGRRRRGSGGGISVAELTGEIPVTRASGGKSSDDKSRDRTAVESDDRTAAEPDSTVERTDPVAPAPTGEAGPGEREASPARKSTPAPPVEAPKAATFALSDVEKTTVTPRVADVKSPSVKAKAPSTTEQTSASVPAPPKIESPTEIIRPEALPRRARAHLGAVATTGSQSGDGPSEASGAAEKKSAKPQGPPAVSVRKSDVAAEPRLLSGPASDLQGTGSGEDGATDTFGPAAAATDSASAESAPSSTRSRKSRSKGESAVAAGGSAREGAEDEKTETAVKGSSLKQWALLIGESVAAIVAGGLLFKGFERLWDLMPWVAFALALLVIVGLVALVRVLRRTDDITSQLIALAVGAFVSFGPLLFLLPDG